MRFCIFFLLLWLFPLSIAFDLFGVHLLDRGHYSGMILTADAIHAKYAIRKLLG